MNIEKQSRAYSIPNIIDLPTIEQPVETELLIPEYCPDIIKILKCDVKNRIINKRIKDNILDLECCAEITIIYCGDDNVVSSVINKYNYSKTIENKFFISNSVDVCINNNSFNCRQTSARRIEIKGSVNINVSIHTIEVKDIIFNIDREDIEQLQCNYDTTTTSFIQEKQLIIEDELLLSSDKPDVNYILRQNAIAIINECKQIGEKAIVKGNIKIDILYCSVNNTPANFSESIPFSQIIELNIKDKTSSINSKANITSFDVKPILSATTNAGFLINLGLNIILIGKSNMPVTLIKDCYSTKVNTDVNKNKILLNKLVETLNERIVIKKTLNLKESQVSTIVDLWCNEDKINAVLESDFIKLTGLVESSILFCNIDNLYECKNFKFDYEFTKKISEIENLEILNLKQKIHSCSYTLISDNQVEVLFEIFIGAEIYEKYECECVSDILENENELKCNDSIIIYYCDKEEKVWNVAKRFSTPLQLLKDQNGITDDSISSQSVLIISRM